MNLNAHVLQDGSLSSVGRAAQALRALRFAPAISFPCAQRDHHEENNPLLRVYCLSGFGQNLGA